MDFSKRETVQTGLAFLVGMGLGALGLSFIVHSPQAGTIIVNKTIKVIAPGPAQQSETPQAPGKTATPPLTSTTKPQQPKQIAIAPVIPVGPPEPVMRPPTAAEAAVKQTDYDSPSYYSTWVAANAPVRAVLVCVHGFGLYSEAFEGLARRLSLKGYPTYSVDARGFGRYMKTDKTMDFDASVNDIGELIKVIKSKYPNAPIVLIGESMGGAIVIQSGARFQKDIAGIIASAPGDLRYKQGKMDLKVGTKLLLRPTKRVEWGDDLLEMASSNTQLHDKWHKDPLVRLKIAPTELLKFQNFMSKTGISAKQILSAPMLFLHGGNDELMKRKGTVELFNDVPSSRKDLFILGQREHVMLEESQFDDKTIRLVEAWLANSFKVPIIHQRTGAN